MGQAINVHYRGASVSLIAISIYLVGGEEKSAAVVQLASVTFCALAVAVVGRFATSYT
ncbi:hypothetical protein EDC63_10476 [Sulfurirhabdus autotrophica]|uniref:Uncharacterized protein n=1 Tax=Sulfurirhabdus autotrophica TaxID=1706046 RepID=A0A4V2W2H7_9PROT|nr:hypothetical protein EDC63_10476 [Sulfurirhabdus autotrophica]